KMFDAPVTSLVKGAVGKPLSADVGFKVTPVPFPARHVVALLLRSDKKLKGEYVAIGAHNDHIGMNNRPVNTDSLRIFNHIVRPGGAEDAGKHATAEQQATFDSTYSAWNAANPGAVTRLDSISNGADDDGSGS